MFADLQALVADHPTLAGWLITVAIALAAMLATLAGYRAAWAAASRLARSRVFATTLLRFARDPARVVNGSAWLSLIGGSRCPSEIHQPRL
jgi:hypothetical protein